MKTHRSSLLILSILSILVLAACNVPSAPGQSGTSPSNPTDSSNQSAVSPTLQITPTPAVQPTKSSGCANTYFPSTPGATWTYANTSPLAKVSNNTRTITDITPTSFATNDAFSGFTVRIKWTCKDGNLAMLDTATITSKTMVIRAASVNSNGYLIPASIAAGNTWSETLNISTSGVLDKTDMVQKNDTKIDCTANGKESVQVQAGKFDALKVTCVYDITTTTDITGETEPGKPVNTPLTITEWYVAGVGLVKTEEVGAISESKELVSYSIP